MNNYCPKCKKLLTFIEGFCTKCGAFVSFKEETPVADEPKPLVESKACDESKIVNKQPTIDESETTDETSENQNNTVGDVKQKVVYTKKEGSESFGDLKSELEQVKKDVDESKNEGTYVQVEPLHKKPESPQSENVNNKIEQPVYKHSQSSTYKQSADLEIFYNNTQISVVGMDQLFSVRLKATSGMLSNVQIFMEGSSSVGEKWVLHGNKMAVLSPGYQRELSIPYEPHRVGMTHFVLYVEYEKDGEQLRLESNEQRHRVYDVRDSAKSVVSNLSINIHNEIKNNTGHANDYNANSTLDSLNRLNQNLDPQADIRNYISQISSCGSYQPMSLYKTLWTPPASCGKGDNLQKLIRPSEPVDNLTLNLEGQLIHLIAGKDVMSFGKRRDNDVVTRILTNSLKASSEANGYISRSHCRIERNSDGDINIFDGLEKPSNWGTAVDGNKMSFSQPYCVTRGRFVLTLASDAPSSDFSMALKCHVVQHKDRVVRKYNLPISEEFDNVAALSIERTDDVDESFMIIWSYCDMGKIHNELSGMIIWQEDGYFGYYTKQKCGYFEDSMNLEVNGIDISVSEISQYGLN